MVNLLSVNISDRTLEFFEQIIYFNDFNLHQKQKLIINTFNSLRYDNGMKLLNDENFQFTCPTAGNWNEEEQTFSVSYSDFNPNIPQIISTIFHEFRHCWQYHNKLELDNLMQQNLDGPITVH